jgi:D-arabinose 1-dehydrogenase-like Zn-dependent alcohol dehydrogenase
VEGLGVRAIDSSDFSSLPKPFSDGLPTVVIDFVGSATTGAWALDNLASRGRLVVLTTFVDRLIPIDYRHLVFSETTVLGSRYATKAEVATAADLVATGKVKPIVGSVAGPIDLLPLHEALRTKQLVGRGALTWEP